LYDPKITQLKSPLPLPPLPLPKIEGSCLPKRRLPEGKY
jgi:hypothetical protein